MSAMHEGDNFQRLIAIYAEGERLIEAQDYAGALHAYLVARCVLAGPPQPFTPENDSIQLGKGTDVKALQGLLDQWS